MRANLRVHLAERAIAERPRLEARRAEAMTIARSTAARLRNEFGATRVAIFGSLAREDFGLDSDIDIVVWGVARSKQATAFCALGAEQDAPGSFGPDIVFADSASQEFVHAIQDQVLDI